MSKVCSQCEKKFMSGNNVSHSKRRTKRHFKPNLTTRVIEIEGTKKKVNICVHCLKTLYKK